MMKKLKTLLTAGLVSTLCIGCLAADAPSNADIEQMFLDDLSVSVTPVTSPAFDGVMAQPIYRLEYKLLTGNEDSARGGEVHVWPSENGLVAVYELNTNDPLTFMDGLLDPAFRLNAETAEQFMSALRVLMGTDTFESVPVEAIQNDGDRWYFVSGDFLSYYKGYMVTVDAEGAIADVEYKLDMLEE